ncbi:branched-chain-amino-acid transaminase [Hydrogenibacillus schlegelii]|uniref:Branched-chain-amino-acid aminotransferase n=1 Tax=Hydrogenibacillus schlegelii TaxID=1484 RepID=A0A132MHI0_HYDSH|nr:branched-chain-amino-acid transaminase [Hydrogenibacillus schlegelii]KWW97215.1 branched-chain amino acid aminotransferase [Hydrogenibacillus schlegelii]OAR05385.1 branched-chain amino acid aminotransferase [Hydrogenibacillus schlegelii]PTQ54415.1 MAG: Branched-chain amino acid aminotransferase [Hydrogenibacillus schlegelii]
MNPGQLIFLNGAFVPKEAAVVSVYDHGLLYGDGVFEGIRAYDGNVFRLKPHIDRLYDSAKAILLEIPYSPAEMEEIVLETLRKNRLHSAYIRIVVSRGAGDLGLDPARCPRANVIVIAESLALYPKELYERGIRLVTVSTRRNRSDVLSPAIKSLNYLNNILAKLEAKNAGADEGLMLNADGYVTEATGENIFIVKHGALITPPPYVGILKGITRQAVMEIAAEDGIPVREDVLTLHDVYTADEVFLTGTAAEIVPVVAVDGRTIGDGRPGAMTLRLLEAFRRLAVTDGTKISPAVEDRVG